MGDNLPHLDNWDCRRIHHRDCDVRPVQCPADGYLPRCTALPLLLGQYSFPIPIRVGGWVGRSGWSYIEMVYPRMVSYLSANCAGCRI